MKLVLQSGKTLGVVGVEESYYPRNTQGIVFSTRMNSGADVEALREPPGAHYCGRGRQC